MSPDPRARPPADPRDLPSRYSAPGFAPLVAEEREAHAVLEAARARPTELELLVARLTERHRGDVVRGRPPAELVEARRALTDAHQQATFADEWHTDTLNVIHLKRDILDEQTELPRLAGELRALVRHGLDTLAGLAPEVERHLADLVRTAEAARRLLPRRWLVGLPEVDGGDFDSVMKPLAKLLRWAEREAEAPAREPQRVLVALRVLAPVRENGLAADRGAIVKVDAVTAVKLLETRVARLRSRDADHPDEFEEPPGAPTGEQVAAEAQLRANTNGRAAFIEAEGQRRAGFEAELLRRGLPLPTAGYQP